MRAYSFITPFIDNLAKLVVLGYVALLLVLIYLIVKIARGRKRKQSIVLYLLIIVIVAFLTFEPGFPIYYWDYAQYFGPILEVINGKTLYAETNSHYGFLSIFIFAIFTKLSMFDITQLPFVIWILYIIQYSLCFYLIYKISRSPILASLALFSIITINYYSLIHTPISVPQSGPMRWFQLVLSIFLVYRLQNFRSIVFIASITVLAFITADAGVSLIFAYLLTLLILGLKGNIEWRKVGKATFYLFFLISLFFFVVNILLVFAGYKFIEPQMIFSKLRQYSQEGFNMIPLPLYTYFWITIFVYFASIIYFFWKKRDDVATQCILFSANISLFASIYYIGRSHPTNLLSVAIFTLLNLYMLLALVFTRIKSNHVKFVVCVMLFFLFIFIPAFNRRVSLAYILYEKINRLGVKVFEEDLPYHLVYHFCKPQHIHIFDSEMRECIERKYKDDAVLINRSIPDDEILIFSPDDTYLFYLTGKKNMLGFNSQSVLHTKEELDFALRRAKSVCPQKIVVDPRLFDLHQGVETLNFFYSIQPNLLDELEKSCQVKYVKSYCSSDICIASVE